MTNRINKYCITNGTVNRVQKDLFEGGHIPGKADISYAIDAARDVMLRGSMRDYQDFSYAGAYSGFVYRSLYCFGKTMFQNASGREIPCSQLLFCSEEDARTGDTLLREIICFPYLSMDELLASETYTKEMVLAREPRDPSSFVPLTDGQNRNIAKAVYWLLQEREVVLQLPVCEAYEELSLAVLYKLFQTLPVTDRCEISFSTARNGNDIRRLNGRLNLFLTSENVFPFGDAKWIRLNGAEELSPEEKIVYTWMNESPNVIEDMSRFFRESRKTDKSKGLKRDGTALQLLYDEKSLWWKAPSGEKKYFSSFREVMEEYRRNPTLFLRENQSQFFESLMKWMRNDSGKAIDGDTWISMLVDYLFEEKVRSRSGKDISLFEDDGACEQFIRDCEEQFGWFGMDDQWRDRFRREVRLLKEILIGA